MRAAPLLVARLSLVLLFACAVRTERTVAPAPPPATRAALAGHRCGADQCRCREPEAPEDQAEAQPPADGLKRFELRVGRTTDPSWVIVDGREILYKGTESAEVACFYLDLSPGAHRVVYRATGARPGEGLTTRLQVAEYDAAGRSWYDTYFHVCGVSEPCSVDEMQRWQAAERALPHGLRDPCGSTRVEKIHWTGDRASGLHVFEAVEVSATLRVYAFSPTRRRGVPACRRP